METEDLYYRDTWAEINLDCITYNVQSMKKLVKKDVCVIAVVKANAYGHGDIETAEAALEAGATHLAVATLDEAFALRRKGITAPLLVLGATRPRNAQAAADAEIALAVFQSSWLKEAQSLLNEASRLKVHLKFDSGMGRIGIRSKEELADVQSLLEGEKRITLEGVFTHFATADELNNEYFESQFARFQEMISWMKHKPDFIHCSNSAAGLRFSAAHLHAVRLGIAMYGLVPSPEMESELPFPLKEAFSLHTKLVHVKKLNKGEKISYGATYEASADEWIGTLPIGYADGWIRKLQGQHVLIDGKRVPIVGRICMDQCMIKLPYELPVGTKVTLIGRQGEEVIPVNDIAAKLETINYEVVCQFGARVPRVYMRDGKAVSVRNGILS